MIKKTITAIFLSTLAWGAQAQSIDSIFYKAPDKILPFLDANSRLDMLDLYNCGMKGEAVNEQMGYVLLAEKDSVHFLVQTTSASRLDLRLLPLKEDTVYACIRTVAMPEEHSQIAFFDRQWQPLPIKLPAEIDSGCCWQPSDSLSDDRNEELRLLVSTMPLYATWKISQNGAPVLVYQVSVAGLLPDDQRDARRCLRALEYEWIDGKFVKVG